MTESTLLPDPSRSAVVVIGTSRYEYLPDLPTVSHNLSGFAAVLRDPGIWGISQERCWVVPDAESPDPVMDAISAACQVAEDTLLVYYAGHGLTDESGMLHLAYTKSQTGKPYTQIDYNWVRSPVRGSPAKRRIVILDCCFSGRAADMTLADESPYAALAAVDGSLVLTATPANQLAIAPADQEYTAFTQELIDVLNEGLAGATDVINLGDVFRNVSARLRSNSRPQPMASDRNNLMQLTGFRNRAFRPGASRRIVSAEDRDAASLAAARHVQNVCLRASGDVLRRERLSGHDRLYIERHADAQLSNGIALLTPSNLQRTERVDRHNPAKAIRRAVPTQIFVLSDRPGAGKTMLTVQLTRLTELCGTVLRLAGSAGESSPDREDLAQLLDSLGPEEGLDALLTARMPLLYVVDGLERADHEVDQKKLIELFDYLKRLNSHARRRGLLAFPLGVLLTLRDREWDRWFTLFEGREIRSIRNALNDFDGSQIDDALERYGSEYGFRLEGEISSEDLAKVAAPLGTRVLSESLEYSGGVVAADVLKGELWTGFLERKAEHIRRLVPGLSHGGFIEVLSKLALMFARTGRGVSPVDEAVQTIRWTLTVSELEPDRVLRALVDERLLSLVHRGVQMTYPSLLEYLVALVAVTDLTKTGELGSLEAITSLVASSPSVSSSAVRANVETMALTGGGSAGEMASNHYATSVHYVLSRLPWLRYEIGMGKRTPLKDLKSIHGSLDGLSPEATWQAFFVIAAARNEQPSETILRVFGLAWDRNANRPDRWKLLQKMHDRGLMHEDEVLDRVGLSTVPREWETLLGAIMGRPIVKNSSHASANGSTGPAPCEHEQAPSGIRPADLSRSSKLTLSIPRVWSISPDLHRQSVVEPANARVHMTLISPRISGVRQVGRQLFRLTPVCRA